MPMFSSPVARPGLPYRDTPAAVATGILLMLIAGWGMTMVMGTIRPFKQATLMQHFTAFFTIPWEWWKVALAERPIGVGGWYLAVFLPALVLGVVGFVYANRKIQPYLHIRGRRLLKGKQAVQAAQKASQIAIGREKNETGRGAGVKIDGLQLSRGQEVESLMVTGAQGGGKTVFINNTLLSADARGDKMIIFDLVKGDYTSTVPRRPRTDGKKGTDTIILSPWDRRSWVWAIGEDVVGIEDANAFSLGLIKGNDDDPMWSDAARAILVAGFLFLIQTHGRSWGWRELAAYCFLPIGRQKEIVDEYYPIASAAVADAGSKTTQSIKINLSASLFPIWDLARRWGEKEGKGIAKFSLRNWMKNDRSVFRKIIVQGNSQDPVLTSAFARALTEYLTGQVCSLQFRESLTRRIWVFLDELPQLGRLSSIARLMEVGRSKGIVACFGFNNIDQIRQIYPRHEEDKWMALFGIRVFTKIRGNASQKWVSDEVGVREVERRQRSVSSGKNASISDNYQRHELPVIYPAELETLIGPRKDGVDVLLLGHGDNALILKFPYLTFNKKYAPFVPASEGPFGPNPPATAAEAAAMLGIPPVDGRYSDEKPEGQGSLEKADSDYSLPPPAIHKDAGRVDDKEEGETVTDFLNHQLAETVVEEVKDEVIEQETDAVGDAVGMSHEAHMLNLAMEVLDALPDAPSGGPPPVAPSPKKRKRRSRYKQHEAEVE